MKSNFKITQKKIESTKRVIEEKKQVWENIFPSLSFDEYGRADIGSIPSFNESDFYNLLKQNISPVFNECWEKTLKQRRLKLISLNEIRYSNFVSKRIIVETLTGHTQERSLTSLLAQAHDFWEDRNPLYRELRNIYKPLSKDRSRADEVNVIRGILKELEVGNMYLAYDHLLKVYQPNSVMISINPLDKLLSAGGSGSKSLTRFETCWANYMSINEDGSLEFKAKGSYSNPKAQVKMGEHVLSGMMFVPNGKKMKVEDMMLYGMKYRSHIWLNTDESYIYLENIYPEKSSSILRGTITSILNEKIKAKTPEELITLKMPETFDGKQWVTEYIAAKQLGNSLYLDKCSIGNTTGTISIY